MTRREVPNCAATVLRALRVLFIVGQVIELRVLGLKYGRTASGFFDNFEKAAAAAEDYNGVGAVYVTANPVDPALLARANNRVRELQKNDPTTSDHDVPRRRFFLIDADPVRPAGISSSDAEHALALARIDQVRASLTAQGWSAPIEADSGNGGHLLYLVDEPNDDPTRTLFEHALKALSQQHSDASVKIDTSVFNAARIWRLYGTLNTKGDHTSQRPHRTARILNAPEQLVPVPRNLIAQLAVMAVPAARGAASQNGAAAGGGHAAPNAARATGTGATGMGSSPNKSPGTAQQTHASGCGAPQEPEQNSGTKGFDLGAWFEKNQSWFTERHIQITKSPWKDGGTKYVFDVCPWNSAHTNSSAYVVQLPVGAIGAGCQHNGCREAGHNWHALRDLIEPDWRAGRGAGDDDAEVVIGEVVPEQVEKLMAVHKRIDMLFKGTAGSKGAALDGPDAYDREFVLALVKKGVLDKSVLATALHFRPGGHAKHAGPDYIMGVVATALKLAAPSNPAAAPPQTKVSSSSICPLFEVESLTKIDVDPPSYRMLSVGRTIPLTSKQLFDLESFRQRYAEMTDSVAPIPRSKAAKALWDLAVSKMLAHVNKEEPPPDTTRHGALGEAIQRALAEFPIVDDPEDLHLGGYLADQTRGKKLLLFTVDAVVRALSAHDLKPSREEIGEILKELGCKWGHPTIVVDDKKRKVASACWYTRPSPKLVESLDGSEPSRTGGTSKVQLSSSPSAASSASEPERRKHSPGDDVSQEPDFSETTSR